MGHDAATSARYSLEQLLAQSGPLDMLQAVTLGHAIAEQLTLLHGAGQAHGQLSLGTVLVVADGGVLLTAATAPVALHTEAARYDVRCVVAILISLLCGEKMPADISAHDALSALSARQVSQPLRDVVLRALGHDRSAAAITTAGDLAARLWLAKMGVKRAVTIVDAGAVTAKMPAWSRTVHLGLPPEPTRPASNPSRAMLAVVVLAVFVIAAAVSAALLTMRAALLLHGEPHGRTQAHVQRTLD